MGNEQGGAATSASRCVCILTYKDGHLDEVFRRGAVPLEGDKDLDELDEGEDHQEDPYYHLQTCRHYTDCCQFGNTYCWLLEQDLTLTCWQHLLSGIKSIPSPR